MNTKQFVCTELKNSVCTNWTQLQTSPSTVLPELTKQEANEITAAVLGIIVLVFGWALIIRMVNKL